MIKTSLTILSSLLILNTSYAGSISSDLNSSQSDEIKSASIKLESTGLYQVFLKTNLETFSIGAKNYADASALAADASKDTNIKCKLSQKIRIEPVSKCKIMEIKFNN